MPLPRVLRSSCPRFHRIASASDPDARRLRRCIAAATASAPYQLGDVDGDGKLDNADYQAHGELLKEKVRCGHGCYFLRYAEGNVV